AGGNKNGICDVGETCVPAPELGLDDAEKALSFASYDINSRIAVTNLDLGPAGIEGDSFVVTFTGTPAAASRANPQLPGTPLLFSNQPGVWSMRVDVRRELKGGGALAYILNGPIPVLQVGDKVGGQVITAINTFDTVSNAAMSAGAIRTQRRGD